ncbi:MAG: hypothetical protein ACTSO9_12935 [Candidatus Helarchaeota archaeon]
MYPNFPQMVERITNASNFEISGGKLEKAIINESNHDQNNVKLFLDRFQPVWKKWVKARGSHLISPFLEAVGMHIFKDFLARLFAFDYNRINVQVEKGRSNVDSNIELIYSYDKDELEILKKFKEKYNIKHISDEKELAKILLSNCAKSITKFLSNIMNIKYRLFTSNIETDLKQDDNLEIKINYDGRIG